MKFLIDNDEEYIAATKNRKYVRGQLLSPKTEKQNWGGEFAIDNGAFGGFRPEAFRRVLEREYPLRKRCLFVTVPDVVGNARRTLELWNERDQFVDDEWPRALVAQDGIENMDIPWRTMRCIFIGGLDPWKDSAAALDIVRTAKLLGKHVHVGRVNTARRFTLFNEAGADTCDGSGVSSYDHMLKKLIDELERDEQVIFEPAE